MDEFLGTIVMIICTIVPTTCLILSVGPNKNNHTKEFTMVLLSQIVCCIIQKLFLYTIIPFDAIISQLTILLEFILIRKIKLPRALICFAFVLSISIVAESLTIMTMTKMGIYCSYEQILVRSSAGTEMMSYYLTIGIYLCISLGIYKICKYLKKKITRRMNISVKIAASTMVLIIYLFIFFKSSTTINLVSGDIYTNFLYFSCAITLICYCGYVYMNINLYRAIERNSDIENQMEMTQALTNELRRFKHNYLNIIHGFGHHIASNGSPELKDYYDQITKESRLISNDNIAAIQKIKNAAFINLIFTHINLMSENSVAFFVNVEDEIGDIVINGVDLCQIMGIFLDNAREAAEETENPLVKLDILKRDGIIEMYLYNTYKECETMDYSRGNGLIYCHNILRKYKMVLHNTYTHNAMFVQQLIIPEK